MGTTVTWANPSTVTWAATTITVPNSLPNKFDPWTYNYTIKVAAGTKWITVIPTTMSTNVEWIRINNRWVVTHNKYRSHNYIDEEMPLLTFGGDTIPVFKRYRSRTTVAVSDGTVITVKVVAPDGVTTSTYTFTVEME